MTTLAITGHRDLDENPHAVRMGIVAWMRRQLIEHKPDEAISSMALGTDLVWAWVCLDMGVPLVAAVPFDGHDAKWYKHRDTLQGLLKAAARVVHVSPPLAATTDAERRRDAGWKLQKRNEWMVDRCDPMLAVWDGRRAGGTWNCLQYAEKIGRRVVRVDPRTLMAKEGV